MTLRVTLRAKAPIPLDLTFAVGPGELLALVGPSGSGKTTTLRTIAGFWRPETARVEAAGITWLDTEAGVCLPTHRRRVGLVFQDYALFPHLTAAQNVATSLGDLPRGARLREAERLLQRVHLNGLGHRRPADLSGGQKQRVALARALARRPDVLLLDEPFSAVDRATRERLYGEIIALRSDLEMPVVLVTHDVNEAQLLADRMLVIDRGRVVRDGTTAEVMADADALRAMGIREAAVMLPAMVAEHLDDGLTRLDAATGPLFLPRIDGAPGTGVRVRIMAHDVILSRARPQGLSAQNILGGTVTRIVPGAGPGVLVHVAVGEHEILARITRRAAADLGLQPGDPVHAILKSMSVARDHVARAADDAGGGGLG